MGRILIIDGRPYKVGVFSLPHVVLVGNVDMEEVFRRLKPVFVKTDRGILKATDSYMDRGRRNIIVDSLAIEGGERERFLMLIGQREEGLVVRLFDVPEVERTEGVKRLLAETAKQLLATFPDLVVGETNLERYLKIDDEA
ncbi:MAG: hypothetical protein KAQ96_03025 [Thermoplasmata archaeon]|nr:hypothetical protein [Thermoplasmata archaeon]